MVEAVRVDGELDPVADRHGRAGVHDDGERGAVVLGEQDVVVDGGRVDRVGEGLGAQARRVDAGDDVGLGAEALDDLDDGGDALAELEIVWADAEDAAALDGRGTRAVAEAAAVGLDQVHRRGADERGDEEVRGVVEELLGRVALLQDAAAQHATRWPSVMASTWSWVT